MEKFQALTEATNKLSFYGNDNPKCPHCGVDNDVGFNDLGYVYEEGEHEVMCYSCHGEFEVSTNVSYTFSTDRQKANG